MPWFWMEQYSDKVANVIQRYPPQLEGLDSLEENFVVLLAVFGNFGPLEFCHFNWHISNMANADSFQPRPFGNPFTKMNLMPMKLKRLGPMRTNMRTFQERSPCLRKMSMQVWSFFAMRYAVGKQVPSWQPLAMHWASMSKEDSENQAFRTVSWE